jgi:hypothetical protein
MDTGVMLNEYSAEGLLFSYMNSVTVHKLKTY